MRITRVILKNFVGIHEGTGRFSLDVSIPKKGSPFVLLFGGNGKGKSTFLQQLHPFPHGDDDRDSLVISGKEGLKKIFLADSEGNRYVAEHRYSKTGKTKSFLFRGNDEDPLNPSGGINSFIDAVKENMGIDPSILGMTSVASDTASFLSKSYSDRKRFVSSYLPDLEEWVRFRKEVASKNNAVTSQIRAMSALVSDIQPFATLEENRESLAASISRLQRNIRSDYADLEKRVGVWTEEDETELKRSEDESRKAARALEKFEELRSKLSVKRRNILEERGIAGIKGILEKRIERISELSDSIASAKAEWKETKERFDELAEKISDGYDPEEDSKTLAVLAKQIEETRARLKGKNLKALSGIENPRSFEMTLEKIETFEETIAEILCSLDGTEWLIEAIPKFSAEALSAEKEKLEEEIRSLEIRFEKIEKEQSILLADIKAIERIEKMKPPECGMWHCGFIKEAKKSADRLDEDPQKEAVIDKKMKSIKRKLEIRRTRLSVVSAVMLFLDRKGSLWRSTVGSLGEAGKNFPADLEVLIREFAEGRSSIRSRIDQLKLLASDAIIANELKGLTESKDRLAERMNLKLKAQENSRWARDKAKKLKEKMNELSSRLEQMVEDKRTFQEDKDTLVQLIDAFAESETATRIKDAFESKMKELRLRKKKAESELAFVAETKQRISEKEKEVASLEERLLEIMADISKRSRFESDLGRLREVSEPIRLVYEAVDPIKGIPNDIVKGSVGAIKQIANLLLAECNSRDKIEVDFVITEKEFRIPICVNGGVWRSDIKLASQGEKALAGLAICMAMVQQFANSYRILLLDEMDASLDRKNRHAFLSMLQKQMESLDSKQAFVISHNEAFDAHPAKLMLFPDHNVPLDDARYIANKKIIFDHSSKE